MINGQTVEQYFAELRQKYQGIPEKLKIIDGFERGYNKTTDGEEKANLLSDLKISLEEYQENPYHTIDAVMDDKLHGYAKFLKELNEYESDTFSAEASKITPEETVLVAGRLIEGWMDNYLDGVSIAEALAYFRKE